MKKSSVHSCPTCGKEFSGKAAQFRRDRHVHDAHKQPPKGDWLLNLFSAKVGDYGDCSWESHKD